MRVRVRNMGTETKTLHVLPTLWFRNTWDWGDAGSGRRCAWRARRSRPSTPSSAGAC